MDCVVSMWQLGLQKNKIVENLFKVIEVSHIVSAGFSYRETIPRPSAFVSVCSGCSVQAYPRLGSLSKKYLIFIGLEAKKYKIKVLADLVFGENLVPGS